MRKASRLTFSSLASARAEPVGFVNQGSISAVAQRKSGKRTPANRSPSYRVTVNS
jgi:hypothetical protein